MTTYEKIKELKEKRAQVLAELRKVNEDAEKAGETIPDDDPDHAWNKGMAEAQDLTKRIQQLEALDEIERATDDPAEPRSDPDDPNADPNAPDDVPDKIKVRLGEDVVVVERATGEDPLAKLLRVDRLRKELRDDPRVKPEYREAFGTYLTGGPSSALRAAEAIAKLRSERRDLVSDDDEQAGYLVPPLQFVAELIQDLDDEVFIRSWARKFTVRQAKSLGAPKRTARLSTFAWSAEVQAPTKDTSLKFGMRNLFPHYLSGEVLVSRDFLRSAVMSGEEIVRREMARDSGEVQEDAFLSGSGAQQPLGVFTASADGISTARDVSTGNTTTGIKWDGLKEAKFSIKAGYWPRLRFLTSRTGVKQLSKEKDGEGRYLWQDSVRVGEPDRVLGIPAFMSERVPATFTTGQLVAIFGDFSHYWIADALDMQIQRLIELEARSNKDSFLARMKTDGMPVLEEPFARVKLA